MRTKTQSAAKEPRVLLTLEEVAKLLRVTGDGRSVRAALRQLGVPVIKIGKRAGRVDAAALEQALSEHGAK